MNFDQNKYTGTSFTECEFQDMDNLKKKTRKPLQNRMRKLFKKIGELSEYFALLIFAVLYAAINNIEENIEKNRKIITIIGFIIVIHIIVISYLLNKTH